MRKIERMVIEQTIENSLSSRSISDSTADLCMYLDSNDFHSSSSISHKEARVLARAIEANVEMYEQKIRKYEELLQALLEE